MPADDMSKRTRGANTARKAAQSLWSVAMNSSSDGLDHLLPRDQAVDAGEIASAMVVLVSFIRP